MSTECHVNMINLTQGSLVDILFDAADAVIEAVDNADVQNAAGLMLGFLHGQGFLVGAGGRLLAENILAGFHGVDGNLGMHIVGGADADGLNFRIVQGVMIILNGNTGAVSFHGCPGSFGDDIAEILDFRLVTDLHIRRNMGRIGNGTAADDCNDNLITHVGSPFYRTGFVLIVPAASSFGNPFLGIVPVPSGTEKDSKTGTFHMVSHGYNRDTFKTD